MIKNFKKILEKDAVTKFQFDYNRNTCFNNNMPEISVQDEVMTVAPGEGKISKIFFKIKIGT